MIMRMTDWDDGDDPGLNKPTDDGDSGRRLSVRFHRIDVSHAKDNAPASPPQTPITAKQSSAAN